MPPPTPSNGVDRSLRMELTTSDGHIGGIKMT